MRTSQDFSQPDPSKTILDLTASKDRDDRWTYRVYDANRHMISLTDPAGQPTFYDWCSCGALNSITDPNGNMTVFFRDVQSRVTGKQFADYTNTYYSYENSTSRLQSVLDWRGSETDYSYTADDNISAIAYSGPTSRPRTSDSVTTPTIIESQG